MLNVVYKMLSSCIANIFFFKVLSCIIHPNQTEFLAERFIRENVRIIYEKIAYEDKEK